MNKAVLSVFLFLLVSIQVGAKSKRPFAEYEIVDQVIMSAGFDYQTFPIKKAIVENLPKEVTLVVFSKYEDEINDFKKKLGHLFKNKVSYLQIKKHGETLWPRDSWPYPVLENDQYVLVDALYDGDFEPEEVLSQFYDNLFAKHSYYFEHGNLASNRDGDCYVVSEIFANRISDEKFQEIYGCQNVTRLPFDSGIGHVDEVLKFVGDRIVLLNKAELVPAIEAKGYKAILLPKAELPQKLVQRGVMPQRSYINSLLVNDTVFVPIFGLDTDKEALRIYRSLGLKVIAIDSSYPADYGGGALHCLTMTYPKMSKEHMSN